MRVQNNPEALVPQKSVGALRSPSVMRDPVLANDRTALIAYARALPATASEAQKKFGLGVFDKMQGDAAVESGIRKWKQEVLSAEFQIVPPPGYEDDAAVKAECEFLRRALDNLETRIEDFAWQALDAGIYGRALIEPQWQKGEGQDDGLWTLSEIRVVPHEMYVLVQDAFGKFLGVIGWVPGHVPLLWEGPIYMPLERIPGFIPAWRFGLYTHNQKAGSIAGRSRLESAYNPFKLKWNNWPLFLKGLKRFSGVIPIGIASPDAEVKDPSKTPEEELAATLGAYEESMALGLPPGTDVKFAQIPGVEAPYLKTIDGCNREIYTAILGSPKTTMEAKNDSQSAQGEAQDAVDEDTAYTAGALCATITRRVLRPLVRANRGPDAICPWLILGTDRDEFVEAAPGAAALYTAGAVADNQEAAIAKKLGLPAPDKALSVRKAEAAPEMPEDPNTGKDSGKPQDKPKKSFFAFPRG